MTIQTFKNDIKNNNITDFTPYLDVKYTEGYRAEMIKNNILVEESVARKEQLPLIAAIEKGYAKTHYKEWSYHQSASVRTALAKNGYFPTHFLTDKDVTVRTAVCYKHPKLAKDLLTKTLNYMYIWNIIKETHTPPVELLEIFLETDIPRDIDGVYKRPVQNKLDVMTQKISPLEASMTVEQLFFANNPLWSKDISIERKQRIDQLTKEYGRDVIGQNIEKLLNVNTYYNTIDELRTKYSS